MKIRMARAMLLATAAIVSCGKGTGGSTTGSTGDAGVEGPTNLVVSWTLAGSAASSATCMAQGAAQVFVNLSGTLDPTLHQSVTVDCATGTTSFPMLLVQDLGTPYLEGTLLDDKGVTVPMGIVGIDVTPMLGTTAVTLAFFAPQNTGGGGAGTTSSSTAASSSTTSSSSHAASSSSGGTGGASTTSSSSSSTTASSSGSSPDAGDGG